ncbi:MAG: 50S ribosomal protein L25/general stress protein Ctc [Cytophagaceae bacterium]|jgi:large subunit ribosomal protein L25|nr:50S ribosomal protein L25/general stress protein Ctc [Cytophagaceae bacterium]
MQKIEIKAAERRDLGKKATKQFRKEELVPGVLYGGKEVVHFTSLEKELNKLIYTPHVYLVSLDVEGKKYDAVIKDLQYHPVTDKLLHIDFLQIFEDKPIVIEIPVQLEGLAEGVKAGGKLQLEQRKLRVRGLAKDLPDEVKIDISHLGLGKTIQVGQVEFPNLEFLNAKNSVVVSVKLTRAARAAAQK